VVGKTEADATAELEKLGLVVTTSERFGAEGQPPGTVTEQFPVASTKVKAGSKVVIIIIR
jgi:beta-lactam-binding protein with PASTA domain